MKVLFYINSISHGGAERVITNLANQFSNADNEVTLVTSFISEWEYPLDDKVNRISICKKYVQGSIKRNIVLVKRLRKILKDTKPDLVVSFMAEPNFRAIIANRGLKSKLILSVRSDPNKEYGNFLFRFLAKTLFRKVDGIVFQTEDAKAWFPKKIQSKSRIIFNQVDEKFFLANVNPLSKDIVTVGRLNYAKQHDLLIKAFKRIEHLIDGKLIIYGEGKLKNSLQLLIEELGLQDRVILAGATKDVIGALSNAKTFVLTSDHEGMPNALMEAMAVGLPCISTDCPCGGPKTLFKGGAGLLVPVREEELLANTMLKVYTDVDLSGKLSIMAKERAKEFYPSKVFSEWNDYFLRLIKK